MSSLEQRVPFDGEFEKPLVGTKDRVAIQALLMPKDDDGALAWTERYADDVSRAFREDVELVRLAKTDHAAAAARLKWMLAAMQEKRQREAQEKQNRA